MFNQSSGWVASFCFYLFYFGLFLVMNQLYFFCFLDSEVREGFWMGSVVLMVSRQWDFVGLWMNIMLFIRMFSCVMNVWECDIFRVLSSYGVSRLMNEWYFFRLLRFFSKQWGFLTICFMYFLCISWISDVFKVFSKH